MLTTSMLPVKVVLPSQRLVSLDYLYSSKDTSNGLKSSQVRLLFPVFQHHPNENYYRLRCESQFVQSFSEIAQISIKPLNQRSNDNFTAAFIIGAMRPSSGRNTESINSNNDSVISKEGDLRIDGLKTTYHSKDRVNLTCRSGKSPVRSTPTKLTWLINNVEANPEMVQTYPVDSLGNSALGLSFNLNQSFLNKWSDVDDPKRSKIILKCYALYEEILFQSSKEQTIRRITRESKSESAAVNTADQVTMNSGAGSRLRFVDQIMKLLITILVIL
uniref:CD80-like immunoglobulin C2-set domain-containing protein n=1 Tax=Tetranychus urticae TaxID=32264 RepID=T1KW41_TETUR